MTSGSRALLGGALLTFVALAVVARAQHQGHE